MSKQDIEKRLGFAAQGVKETTRTSAKAKFGIWGDAPDKYRAAIDFIQNQRTPSSAAISDLKKAIKNRQSEAVKTRDPKAKRMYEDDAGGLQNVLEHAQRGDHSTLLRSAYNLDTAVRDDIPIEMFIWAGADVNWSHRNAKSLLDTVSALVNRTKHGKSVKIKAARPGVKAKMETPMRVALTPMHTRAEQGYENFISNLMKLGGITREQAQKAFKAFKDAKVLVTKEQYRGGGITVKHGAFMERDVIRRAAGLPEESSRPGVKAKA